MLAKPVNINTDVRSHRHVLPQREDFQHKGGSVVTRSRKPTHSLARRLFPTWGTQEFGCVLKKRETQRDTVQQTSANSA